MDKYIGQLLDGRYEILQIIGVGGMAVVYKAMDHRLNRLVAIKILKDDYSGDAEFRRRFHGESQAVAMMSHPNIVSVYDVSKNNDADYIVMELIDGITLKQYMEQKGPLSWRETLHFAMQIAKALEHAHGRNIIHRDIKPHNVMILKDGSVKVADFGIARVASAQNTLTKEALGSVHYISPEQARGGRVDNRTDIYSLGVVMYEMLTGRPPYDGETPVSVAIQHINGTPLSPSLLNSTIPTGLEQITMHAMCSDINIRYSSISDMLKDMEEFRKNPAIRFTFLPAGVVAGTASGPRLQPNRQPGTPTRQPQTARAYELEDKQERSRRILMIVGLALLLAALIGIAVLVISFAGGKNSSATTEPALTEIEVPQFVGQNWADVSQQQYEGLKLTCYKEYSTEHEEIGYIFKQSIDPHKKVKPGTEIEIYVSLGVETNKMPDLTGSDETSALLVIEALKVKALTEHEESEEYPEGTVIRTVPAVDETISEGQTVVLYISSGKKTNMVKVPGVVGATLANAKISLESKNLTVDASESVYSSNYEAGRVVSQTPVEGTEVEEGTIVKLYISKGREPLRMITVMGESESSAEASLKSMGLKVKKEYDYSDTAAAGIVIGQSVSSGEEIAYGSEVQITVSLGPKQTTPEPTDPEPTDPPGEDPGPGETNPPDEP